MANELRDLHIEEVSAVDRPANKGARVVLLKRLAKRLFGQWTNRDASEAILEALRAGPASGYDNVWVDEFSASTVAYSVSSAGEPYECYTISYSLRDGTVALEGEPTPVEQQYVPKAATKTEGGKQFPASDYAYVPDPESPSTWKLRLTATPGGAPDPRIVGAAVAALGKGFRGNRVSIPAADRAAVVARVRSAWRKAHPDAGADALPGVLKQERGIMNDDDRVGLLKRLITHLGLGAEDVAKMAEEEEDMPDDAVTKQIADLAKQVENLRKRDEASQRIAKAATQADLDKIDAGDDPVLKERKEAREKVLKDEAATAEADKVTKAFRDKLPEELQKVFDGLDTAQRKSFMERLGKGGDQDDPVAKALAEINRSKKELEDTVHKLRDAERERELRAELAPVGKLMKLDDAVALVRKAEATDEAAAAELVTQLKALAAQADTAGLFKVLGSDGAGDDTAEARIQAAVRKRQEAHPDETPEQAEAEVLKTNPRLYEDYNREREGK